MEQHPVTSLDFVLADLDATERGFVLGLLLGGEGEPTTTSLAEPAATRCREAVLSIAQLPRAERVRWMGLLAREALAPLPPGIEDVAEDVLREALAPESASTIRVIAAQGPPVLRQAAAAMLSEFPVAVAVEEGAERGAAVNKLGPNAVADLQRAVMTRIVPVPPVAQGAKVKRLGRKLATLRPPDLLTELAISGADLLGVTLRGADEVTLKRAIARTGATYAERILGAARTSSDATGGADDMASRSRARALAGATTPGDNPQRTLERLGARDLGERLGREDPDLVVSVAQRLPRAVRLEFLAAAGR
jgi:hypothetical protein